MIDIHSHILPGVDDGAQSMSESIEMARAAVNNGIHTIVATPHHKNGAYTNEKDAIEKLVSELNKQLEKENIPLTVIPGQETRINGDMIEELENGKMLPLNHTKYVFVEFSHSHVPRYASQMLFDIQIAGYIPVIVHPERNEELLNNPTKMYEFIKRGALSQITAASLVGKFGKKTQKFSQQLIESNLTHFIATDAHNTTSRGFVLQEAYDVVEREFGSDIYYMFLENSQLLLENETVHVLEPMHMKKKKFLGIF